MSFTYLWQHGPEKGRGKRGGGGQKRRGRAKKTGREAKEVAKEVGEEKTRWGHRLVC